MKHQIPLETRVAFAGDGNVYVVDGYTELLFCEQPCPIGHESDCFEEPYISVRHETRTAFPLSKLETVFDKEGLGRDPTKEEKTPQP